MLQMVLIGIGAGAATALLFASVASGAVVAILLFYLAPLPILIAAVGWSHWAALIAAVTASAGLAVWFGGTFFLAFLIGIGLPAWWLGYLTLLARPAAVATATPGGLEWYPVGNLVVWTAILGAVVVAGVILHSGGADADNFRSHMRSTLDRMLNVAGRTDTTPTDLQARKMLLDTLVVALPLFAGVLTTMVNAINLYLAVRVAHVSGRLKRPMPELGTMRFPVYTPVLTALAFIGCLLPGMVGILSGVLAAALMMAYAILGFAVLHVITRGMSARPFVIGAVYAAVIVFFWPLLMTSVLGLADSAFNFRGRVAAKRGPPGNVT